MGTHPIFESDFDCLTDRKKWAEADHVHESGAGPDLARQRNHQNRHLLRHVAKTKEAAAHVKLVGSARPIDVRIDVMGTMIAIVNDLPRVTAKPVAAAAAEVRWQKRAKTQLSGSKLWQSQSNRRIARRNWARL